MPAQGTLTAPPVYRPQPAMIRALGAAVQPKTIKPVTSAAPPVVSTAPPVYRPFAGNQAAQPKLAGRGRIAAGAPAAPPVYVPQRSPIVQAKMPAMLALQKQRPTAPPVYNPGRTSPAVQRQIEAKTFSSGGVLRPPAPFSSAAFNGRPQTSVQLKKTEGTQKAWPYSNVVQAMKRTLKNDKEEEEEDDDKHLDKKKKTVGFYSDPYAYLDDEDFGKNEDYEEEIKKYNKQQVEKKKNTKEDPKASTITYSHTSGKKEEQLTVHGLDWMGQNWTNLKGNLQFGTYATTVVVDGQPFYFRAQNTMDVGLAPMTLGTKSGTYVSSKNRPFKEIASELDYVVATSKDKKIRSKIGKSILNAIKGKTLGTTTTNFKGMEEDQLFMVQSLIAEIAAIWALDLFRSEGNQDVVLQHQEELLTGTKTFTQILTQGVYMGMKAVDLRNNNSL